MNEGITHRCADGTQKPGQFYACMACKIEGAKRALHTAHQWLHGMTPADLTKELTEAIQLMQARLEKLVPSGLTEAEHALDLISGGPGVHDHSYERGITERAIATAALAKIKAAKSP